MLDSSCIDQRCIIMAGAIFGFKGMRFARGFFSSSSTFGSDGSVKIFEDEASDDSANFADDEPVLVPEVDVVIGGVVVPGPDFEIL